jgi:hypothetical protein
MPLTVLTAKVEPLINVAEIPSEFSVSEREFKGTVAELDR